MVKKIIVSLFLLSGLLWLGVTLLFFRQNKTYRSLMATTTTDLPPTPGPDRNRPGFYQEIIRLIATPTPPIPPFSYDRIFGDDRRWLAAIPKEILITLVFAGDVMLGRTVNLQAIKTQNFRWLFEPTADIFQKADLAFVNLESPLVTNCPGTSGGMIFCGDPGHTEGLVFAGIDLANLANNHALNYGSSGLEQTIRLLEEKGIAATGVTGAIFKEIKNKRLAFLGYNDTFQSAPQIAQAGEEKIRREVSEAKKQADLLVVAFHWGEEYTRQPTSRQQILAHAAVEAGADLVIGHHPHWIQPVEIYHDRVILYSHGNFIFDQMWSTETRQGIASRATFLENQLIDLELLPVEILSGGQPRFLLGEEKKTILEKIKQASEVTKKPE